MFKEILNNYKKLMFLGFSETTNNKFIEATENETDEKEWKNIISENEWREIENNKENILRDVPDRLKDKFNINYDKLKSHFDKAWKQVHKTTSYDLSFFKNELINWIVT